MKPYIASLLLLFFIPFYNYAQSKFDTKALTSIHGEAFKRVAALDNIDIRSLLQEKEITLQLFDDLTISAKQTNEINQLKEGTLWHGDLTNGATGYMELFSRNGYFSGTIYTATNVYKLDGKADETLRVIELNPNIITDHDCSFDAHPTHDHENTITRKTKHKAKATAENPSIIDIMILYPPSIETDMGGAAGMENEIYYRIAEANQVFSNSKIYVELRLVHHQSTTLVPATAQSAGDVRVPGVVDLREQYKADLVSFWSDNGSAGSGYNFEGTGSPTTGYNTSRFTLVQTYYTFIHECGHNMGAKHDRQAYHESSPTSSKLNVTPYYRYGKSFVGYRSVMSYGNCNDLPGGSSNDCERVPYFTNPDILVNGEPFGVPGDYQTYDVNGPANNALRINEAAPYIEAWYESLNTNYFSLDVTNGTGSGSYAENTTILISAAPAPEGMTFDQWTGDTDEILDIYSFSTSLTITDSDLNISASYRVIDYSKNVTINIPITSGNDDVEEYGQSPTTMYLTSTDLELTLDGSKGNQTIGLLFHDLRIPSGMEVQSASIRFTAEGSNSGSTSLSIATENNVTPLPFTDQDLSSRLQTNSIPWTPSAWTLNETYTTPDLSTIIQPVIEQEGWKMDNSLAFIITGTGLRSTFAFEGDEQKVAVLTIVFKEKPNQAPILTNVTNQVIPMNSDIIINTSMIEAYDPDGDPLSIILGSGTNYTFEDSTLTPAFNFVGDLFVPIKVTDENLESSELTMTITVDALTSLTEQEALLIEENRGIDLSNYAGNKNIQVIDLKGKVLYTFTTSASELRLENYISKKGLYLIKVETTESIISFKAWKK